MYGKRILPPTYLLVAIVVMVALHFLLSVIRITPLPWNVLGILSLVVGVAPSTSLPTMPSSGPA